MPKNKKKFNKKTATTFSLVQRSLEPIDEDDPDSITRKNETDEELYKRKEEENRYGIFFSDDYDYMQHLREVGAHEGTLEYGSRAERKKTFEEAILSSIGTEKDTSVNAGRYADVRPDRKMDDHTEIAPDPELNIAMEESFDLNDPNNILDDNFILQADARIGPEVSDEDDEEGDDYPGLEESEEYVDPTSLIDRTQMVNAWISHHEPETEEEESGSLQKRTKQERKSTASLIKQWVSSNTDPAQPEDLEEAAEEKRSRFSNYSMTSSVMRRTKELSLLDDRFAKMFEQYDEEEIGGLDMEDLEGTGIQGSVILDSLIHGRESPVDEQMSEQSQDPDAVALRFQYEDMVEPMKRIVIREDDDKFDCQSIISLRSNRSFQPKILDVPRKVKPVVLDSKTGIPKDTAIYSDDSDSESSDGGSDILSLISSLSVARPKNETPEERKLRKHTLKELRRERRVEKKNNRIVFKDEKIRQERDVIGAQHRLKSIAMN